ncbi:MAG: fatty acyl-AMP ligase [Nannocystaceae bacterium]
MRRPPATLAHALEEAASIDDARFTFLDEEAPPRVLTYAELARESRRVGGALQARGLGRGDRVALILPDNAEFVLAFLGAVRAGVVPVPIYPPTGLGKLTTYLENTLHIVARSGARVLLTSREVKALLGTVQARAPELREVTTLDALCRGDAPLRPERLGAADTCFLQFTSGSTARPKGVVLSHGNLAANVRVIMEEGLQIRDDDCGLSWLPLYHDMGLIGFVIAPLFHRRSITFMPPLLFLKRPVRWLEEISRLRATISFGPNFAYALCVKRVREREMSGLDLSSWRVAGCGAEPIREGDLRAFSDKFAAVGFDPGALVPSYGMAESTLAVTLSPLGRGVAVDHVDGERLWSEGVAAPVVADAPRAAAIVRCGGPAEGHEVAIFGADDLEGARPLGDREVGEIRVRGPSVTAGYFAEPERSAAAFAGGWLRTGDLGYLADGEVHICGRAKEVIILHGRNYYPQDLEWEASQVAGVRKGNVIAFGTSGADDARERVVVTFETAAPAAEREAIAREIRIRIQDGLGLSVDEVIALDAGVLPKTSSGKLQRARTRELYEAGELGELRPARGAGRIDLVKALVRSQLGYFRHRVLGGGERDEP